MTLRNWFRLFWTTLLAGAVAAVAAGLTIAVFDEEFRTLSAAAIAYNIGMMAAAGLMFSILSQMGFFAYMTLNYIARDIFRKPSTWSLIQLFFVITVPFELWFFVWKGSIGSYLIGAGLIMVLSLATAWWKVKLTKPSAFIPALFFMSVATMLEAAIAVKANNISAAILMVAPLLACNARQILALHKLVSPSGSSAVKA